MMQAFISEGRSYFGLGERRKVRESVWKKAQQQLRFVGILLILFIAVGCQSDTQLVEPGVVRKVWGTQEPERVYQRIFAERSVEILYPLRLKIPALGVDAAIEAVGRDASGAMEIPSDPYNGAWYSLGPVPGAVGNAVIAGHLDLANGKPAVFWGLGRLKAGDQVQVEMSDGSTLTFAVEKLASYLYDQAPLEEIFGFRPEPYLNLITCAGSWNKASGVYNKRLVAYTRLIDEQNARYDRFVRMGDFQ